MNIGIFCASDSIDDLVGQARQIAADGFETMWIPQIFGVDAITGEERYVMGSNYLWDGIPLVPTLTGMFAISQMIELALKGGAVASAGDAASKTISGVGSGIAAVFKHWTVLLRGSVIGTVIGIFILRIMRNGIVMIGVPGLAYNIFIGAMILGMMTLHSGLERRRQAGI